MDEFDKKHFLAKLSDVMTSKRYSTSARQNEIEGIVNFGSDDKEFLIDAAAISGSVAKYLEDQWLSDFDVALACVKKNPGQIVDFSPEIQDRDEIVEAATDKHPFIYCLLNDRHRARKEIFEKTLEHDQLNIKNFLMAPMEFRDDINVINTYMDKDPVQTYENMPEKYRLDKEYLIKYVTGKLIDSTFRDSEETVDYIKSLNLTEQDKVYIVAKSITNVYGTTEKYIPLNYIIDIDQDYYSRRELWHIVINNIKNTPNQRFRNTFQDFYNVMPEFLRKEIDCSVKSLTIRMERKKNKEFTPDEKFSINYSDPKNIKYSKRVLKLAVMFERRKVKFEMGNDLYIALRNYVLTKKLDRQDREKLKNLPKIEDLINVKNLSGDNLNTVAIPMKSTLNKKSGRLKI